MMARKLNELMNMCTFGCSGSSRGSRVWFVFYVVFMLANFPEVVQNWKIHHRGRSVGGMLGQPNIPPGTVRHLPPDEWLDQQLDHFNPTDDRTWKQRYFTNNTFYKSGGPVFLMIGGEGTASPEWMVDGQWIQYAGKYHALCFQLEHRFYGKSHPTEDLSVKNLVYLSSEQALADIAYFIEAMKEKYQLENRTKWVTFGGSYPGSLSAWMRLKYPHLVHASVSASGPLLAKIDFQEYFGVVEDSLASYNENCVSSVSAATRQLSLLLKHRIGQQNVDKLFSLCDNIDVSVAKDVSNLYESLAGNFAEVVQYNKDNRIGKSSVMKTVTIDAVCDIMMNTTLGPAIDRFAAVNKLILTSTNQTCLDYKYDKMIKTMQGTSWDSETAEGGRQWTYQTCTEFGFFQTSTMSPHLFGDDFPVDFFINQCVDIFGPRYNGNLLNHAVNRTNTIYGAYSLEVSRVVFVHGSIDPWHALGITSSLSKDAPAIYIQGTAHCANMYPSSSSDLPQLTAARKQIENLLGQWLHD